MLKKIKKNISIPLAIIVGLGLFGLSKIVNASNDFWFVLITIILLLIYFESYDKK